MLSLAPRAPPSLTDLLMPPCPFLGGWSLKKRRRLGRSSSFASEAVRAWAKASTWDEFVTWINQP